MTGIEYRDTDAFIDEIPAAYKDIDQVLADAADLVEVRHTLRQVVNRQGRLSTGPSPAGRGRRVR
jgi:tRNA-splicing ligase RtcB